jgi:hypothetical protein
MNSAIEKLGPSPFGAASTNVAEDLAAVQRALSVTLPAELVELLVTTGSALMFDEGARFKPDEPSGIEDDEGFQGFSMIYGLADDEYGLREINETYRDQFPCELVAIGEAPGGNQICLDPESGQVVFWNHEAETDDASLSLIANDLASFLARLEPDNPPMTDDDGVVSCKLDF